MWDYNKSSLVASKSLSFAIRCVKLYRILCSEFKEYHLSAQLLRSGTSIGANIKEALRAQSDADFGAKMNIALKEASENEYWIELFHATEFISDREYESLKSDCIELIKMLTAIVRTTFENINSKKKHKN